MVNSDAQTKTQGQQITISGRLELLTKYVPMISNP